MTAASVIVPAHNEASVIGRCLSVLTADADLDELEVIVVCNGCTDDTAAIAASYAGVRVIETPLASKVAALNLGDAAASVLPRIFVDADVVMSTDSVRILADWLGPGGLLAASPRAQLNQTRCSRPMRGFQAVSDLTDFRQGGMSGGVYGLSAAGRQRFGLFPNVIADDLFIRSLFTPDERATVQDATVTVWPSTTIRGFVRRAVRGQAGNRQLADSPVAASLPSLPRDRRRHLHLVGRVLTRPRLWLDVPIFAAVTTWIRVLGRRKFAHGDLAYWDRDDSNRWVSDASV